MSQGLKGPASTYLVCFTLSFPAWFPLFAYCSHGPASHSPLSLKIGGEQRQWSLGLPVQSLGGYIVDGCL